MKRFNGTTLIIVVVLLGVLVGVGHIVNPPPPGPPAPPSTPPTGSQTVAKDQKEGAQDMQKRMREEMEAQRKRYQAMAHAKANQPKPKIDPNQIEVNSSYFNKYESGVTGTEHVEKDVAEAKALQQKSAPPPITPMSPPGSPTGAPNTPAPSAAP
jgi:hypothetical protein